MRIYIINEVVYFNLKTKTLEALQEGKVYEIPDGWARIFLEEGSGAEWIKISKSDGANYET